MAACKTYAILPAIGAPPEGVVRSMMSLQRTNIPVIYLHSSNDPEPEGPDLKAIYCECDTLGDMIETVRQQVEADLFLWIPPGVEVLPNGLDRFIEAFEDHPNASVIMSNYFSDTEEVAIHPFRDDITEREDFGAVWGISAKVLEKIGGADRALKHATFYDLRLKLVEEGELVHVVDATHSVFPPAEEEAADAGNALFYPGKGAFGGFSYLFMDPEEEKETEEVIYSCLKRRGAFLELPDREVPAIEHDEEDPLVTVVIPVHNRAKFLPLAIDSVLRGTFQDFEIIVVDNASTDASVEVAQEYAKRDTRISVLKNDVNVIAMALNMGVKAARGKYIAQLDSDDEYTPNALKDMVGHFEAHPKCGLAISYYELMNEQGKTLEEFGVIEHLEYNLNNIMRVDGAGAVRVWHKGVVEEFGGFNETDFPNYGEDYDLVLKASERYHVDRVCSVCYRYRRHPGNTDALRMPVDKIRAKTQARTWAITRRRKINGHEA